MTDLGTIDICYRFTITRTSKHSPARLWRAITDPGEVSAWMSYPAQVDLRVGGRYFVDFTRTAIPGGASSAEAPGGVPDDATLNGIIVAVEPERLLRYVWGNSVVDWAMAPAGEGCRHTFSQNGLYPRDIPDEEGLAGGWHAFLEDLDRYLDTGAPTSLEPRPRESRAGERRWLELSALYRPLLREALGNALKGPDERQARA